MPKKFNKLMTTHSLTLRSQINNEFRVIDSKMSMS